jgi:hypothetical protein
MQKGLQHIVTLREPMKQRTEEELNQSIAETYETVQFSIYLGTVCMRKLFLEQSFKDLIRELRLNSTGWIRYKRVNSEYDEYD